jgi:hypothetical protein
VTAVTENCDGRYDFVTPTLTPKLLKLRVELNADRMLNSCRSFGVSRARGYERLQRGRYLSYPASSFPKPLLSCITTVDPFTSRNPRFLKSANKRVTVSREAPIIWAISS